MKLCIIHHMFNSSRITIFAGHYGSGKTNLAVNYAIRLKETKPRVAICDLDIVNPYYRTADFAELFSRHGVTLITSPYANTNVDMPAVPSGAQAVFDDKGLYSVVDLGGDDRGALALGRYVKRLSAGEDYDLLWVVNVYRPLTRGMEDLLGIKDEIETAAGIRFTGIGNNANLGAATAAEDISASFPVAEALSRKTGLPVKMTAARRGLFESEDIFSIDLYEKSIWKV